MPEYIPGFWSLDEPALIEGDEAAMLACLPVPPPREPSPLTTVVLNGREVTVPRDLLARPGEAPAVTVTVTVNLTVEDVVAVLVHHNVTYAEELSDGRVLQEIVAEAVLNTGCSKLEEWRHEYPPDLFEDAEEEVLAYVADVRARATEVFGVVTSHA